MLNNLYTLLFHFIRINVTCEATWCLYSSSRLFFLSSSHPVTCLTRTSCLFFFFFFACASSLGDPLTWQLHLPVTPLIATLTTVIGKTRDKMYTYTLCVCVCVCGKSEPCLLLPLLCLFFVCREKHAEQRNSCCTL